MSQENKFSTKFYHPIFLIFIYLVVHVVIRLSLSETFQVDDREQIFYAQELLIGYPFPQPPLYSWISWISFKLFGSSLFSLTFVKYILIFSTFIVIWLISQIIIENRKHDPILLFSFLLMPSFFWHMHQGFTHTILLSLGIVLVIFSLLKLREKNSIQNYIALGLSMSILFLSKYSFLIFIFPIMISAFSIFSFRQTFLSPRILISLSILLLCVLPHYTWVYQNFFELSSTIQNKLNIQEVQNVSTSSLSEFFLSSLGFIFPLVLFLFLAIKPKKINSCFEKNDYQKLFERFFLVIGFIMVLLSIFLSIGQIKVRWLHPIWMLFPFWLILQLERKEKISKKIIYLFKVTVVTLSLLIITVRIFQSTLAPSFGLSGRINVPITETIRKIPHQYIDDSLIITNDFVLLPHLISYYPNKIKYGDYLINKDFQYTKCIYISSKKKGGIRVSDSYSTPYGNETYRLFLAEKDCQSYN